MLRHLQLNLGRDPLILPRRRRHATMNLIAQSLDPICPWVTRQPLPGGSGATCNTTPASTETFAKGRPQAPPARHEAERWHEFGSGFICGSLSNCPHPDNESFHTIFCAQEVPRPIERIGPWLALTTLVLCIACWAWAT